MRDGVGRLFGKPGGRKACPRMMKINLHFFLDKDIK
jgi:hypothetical protein